MRQRSTQKAVCFVMILLCSRGRAFDNRWKKFRSSQSDRATSSLTSLIQFLIIIAKAVIRTSGSDFPLRSVDTGHRDLQLLVSGSSKTKEVLEQRLQ